MRAYPELDHALWKISNSHGGSEPGGGLQPRWRGDGRELFYLAEDEGRTLMAVPLQDEPTFEARPRALFRTEALVTQGWSFDAAADGEAFVVRQEVNEEPQSLTVVVNWATEL